MADELSCEALDRLAEEVARGCPAAGYPHAGGYCPFEEGAKLIRAFGGVRLVPDAAEKLARWLWTQDAGGADLWPRAGESVRRPFVEAAEDILSIIAAPSGAAQ